MKLKSNAYHQIIVAVENDEMDQKLCNQAKRLAEAFDAKIELVHVIDLLSPLMISSIGGISPIAVDHVEHSQAAREHANAIKSVKLSLSSLAASMISPAVTSLVIEATDIRKAIHNEAIAISADLIIVGSWGRSGLALFFEGATASNMLRDSPCDVLAISMN